LRHDLTIFDSVDGFDFGHCDFFFMVDRSPD